MRADPHAARFTPSRTRADTGGPSRTPVDYHGHTWTQADLCGLLQIRAGLYGHDSDTHEPVRTQAETAKQKGAPGRLKRSVAGAERFASAGLLPSACGHGRLTAWLRPVYLFQGRLGVKDNLVASIPRNIGLVRPRHARAGGIAVVR